MSAVELERMSEMRRLLLLAVIQRIARMDGDRRRLHGLVQTLLEHGNVAGMHVADVAAAAAGGDAGCTNRKGLQTDDGDASRPWLPVLLLLLLLQVTMGRARGSRGGGGLVLLLLLLLLVLQMFE